MTWVCDRGTFIHIPKCAGHSVMEYYPGRLYQEGWLHQPRSKVNADKVWTIVRHPVTRLVSYWLYEKRMKRTNLECIEWLRERKPKSMDWYLDGPVDEILHFEKLPNNWPHLNNGNTKPANFYTWNTGIEEYIIKEYTNDYERFGYERTLDRKV